MTHSIYPALRFKKNAKTALEWYCSIFPNSQIMQEHDTALKVQFAGVPFIGINGGPPFPPIPLFLLWLFVKVELKLMNIGNN